MKLVSRHRFSNRRNDQKGENVEEHEETYDPNQNNQQDHHMKKMYKQTNTTYLLRPEIAAEKGAQTGRLVEASVDSNENGVLDQL